MRGIVSMHACVYIYISVHACVYINIYHRGSYNLIEWELKVIDI